MQTFFLICAAFGGTLMVCQFLASLLGLAGDHDTDHGGLGDAGHDAGGHVEGASGHDAGHGHEGDHGGSAWYFGMLSFRALSAAFAFFGLAGLAAHFGGLEPGQSLLVALAAGFVALYAVAAMMRMLAGLKSDGTVRIERAIGVVGTVYLRIPGRRAGAGKVTLVLQGRTVECPAITAQEELPTGSRIQVVAVVGPDTLEVAPVTTEIPAHVQSDERAHPPGR